VPLERPDGLFINRLQAAIFEFDPDAEVGDGVEMESGNLAVVPAPDESPLIFTEEVSEDWRPDSRQAENWPGVVDMHVIPPWRRNHCPGEETICRSSGTSTTQRADPGASLPTSREKLQIVLSSRQQELSRARDSSCKGRGFCPSCVGRHMADTAAHLVDHVVPHVPVRQWVFTVPFPLRFRMAFDRKATSTVRRILLREVLRFHRQRARPRPAVAKPATGAICFLQRFGSALNLNPHFHVLVLDGAFDPPADLAARPMFTRQPSPTDAEIEDLLDEITTRLHDSHELVLQAPPGAGKTTVRLPAMEFSTCRAGTGFCSRYRSLRASTTSSTETTPIT